VLCTQPIFMKYGPNCEMSEMSEMWQTRDRAVRSTEHKAYADGDSDAVMNI